VQVKLDDSDLLAEEAQIALDFIDNAEWNLKGQRRLPKFHRVPLGFFSGAEVLANPKLTDKLTNEIGYFREVKPTDLTDPLDVCWLTPPSKQEYGYKYLLMRVRKTVPAYHRGMILMTSAHMVEVSMAFMFHDRSFNTTRQVFAYINDRWLCVLKNDNTSQVFFDLELHNAITMAHSIFFSRRYDWQVAFNQENGLAVSFPTDITGIRELFKSRNTPIDKDRRAALRHWVQAHTRKRRTNPNDFVFIREHLRGAVEFNWHGLHSKITPSRYDIDRLERGQ
jgi:hypothetical protein